MIRTHYGQHGEQCYGCKVRGVQLTPTRAFQPHYNQAVGQFVSTDREFRDALKRCGERNSISTGITHDYEPRYPGDVKLPYPDADQAIENRDRKIHDYFAE